MRIEVAVSNTFHYNSQKERRGDRRRDVEIDINRDCTGRDRRREKGYVDRLSTAFDFKMKVICMVYPNEK